MVGPKKMGLKKVLSPTICEPKRILGSKKYQFQKIFVKIWSPEHKCDLKNVGQTYIKLSLLISGLLMDRMES